MNIGHFFYTVLAVAQNKQTTSAMACSKVIDVPGYPDRLNAIMGRYSQKLQHILSDSRIESINFKKKGEKEIVQFMIWGEKYIFLG